MSRDNPKPSREELLGELNDLVRSSQRATDLTDDLVCQLLGINRTDARCLDILEQRGEMSAGDLAREAGITTGAVTALIDRLAKAGFVQRVADPDDRRRVLVQPTARAKAAGEDLFGPIAGDAARLLARYTKEELGLLVEFHRLGAEVQARHAEFLRERLRARERRPA
jgi:DNA-binding MarR family transcriptional regulator